MTLLPQTIRGEFALFAISLALPLVLLTGYGLYDRNRDDIVASEGIARRLAESNADRVSEYVAGLRATLEAVARRPLVRAMDAARCDPRLADLVDLYPRVGSFTVIDRESVIICSSRPLPRDRVTRVADEELQREMRADPRFRVTKLVVSTLSGRWAFGLVQPVLSENGALLGTVAAGIDPLQWNPFPHPEALPADAIVTVVTSDGTIIARSVGAEKWINRKLWDERLLKHVLTATEGVVRAKGVDGVDRIFGVSAVAGLPWIVLAGLPEESVFAPARERLVETGAFLALVVGGALVLAWVFAARLAKLEDRVRERTVQLEAANKELEAFGYSVSHDLRAPLRAIDGFSRIVQEDYAGKLDLEGQRLLGVIRDNSQKMAQLIDDLLEYSRLGRKTLSSAAIDMNRLVEEVLGELQVSGGSSHRLVLAALPPVRGDATLLKQTWTNLLANAIKFSGKREQPVVEVSGRESGVECVYCVKDNGSGFEMRYYEKLFKVFQRLHREDEFEGTGVGLAIVQRVVSRHGGRVWAEGKVDEGAAFYFSLPKGTQDGQI